MATQNSEAALDGERPPLIKPGQYDVVYERHYTWMMFGRAPKLTLCFRIVTLGEAFEQRLQRHYNVRKIIGKPSNYGRFKVGFSSDFLRDYSRLFGAPSRMDRIPMSRFENRIIGATVRTVEKGSDQRAIPKGLEYSIIQDLQEVKQ